MANGHLSFLRPLYTPATQTFKYCSIVIYTLAFPADTITNSYLESQETLVDLSTLHASIPVTAGCVCSSFITFEHQFSIKLKPSNDTEGQ